MFSFIKTVFNKFKKSRKVYLPESPIQLQGHYLQVTNIPDIVSKNEIDHSVLTTKALDITVEKLRYVKFPDKYCSNPKICIVVFKENTFVSIKYLYWLLNKHFQTYETEEEFNNNVTIHGAINNKNFKNIIKNYYNTHKQ